MNSPTNPEGLAQALDSALRSLQRYVDTKRVNWLDTPEGKAALQEAETSKDLKEGLRHLAELLGGAVPDLARGSEAHPPARNIVRWAFVVALVALALAVLAVLGTAVLVLGHISPQSSLGLAALGVSVLAELALVGIATNLLLKLLEAF